MAKGPLKNLTDEDDDLLAELGIEVETKTTTQQTPREERIMAGFEGIEQFYVTHGRLPLNGEDKDIFERLQAVRLDKIRSSNECLTVLAGHDAHGLLAINAGHLVHVQDDLDDEALLAELGVLDAVENDITQLTHVRPRAVVRAEAEEIAQRKPCVDFELFKPLFAQVQLDLKAGIRVARSYKRDAKFNTGEFYILGGQTAYIAEMGEWFQTEYGNNDTRLRVIFDNGTESNLLYRSFQKSLSGDDMGRRISDSNAGPLFEESLFEENLNDGDAQSGTIYVLKSLSKHPTIQQNQAIIHKIGVTGGDVKTRIANAQLDPTFLMAGVEVVATYELYNINRSKLEHVLHRFFEAAKLDIQINDRFGQPVVPREWFLVPLFVIDEVVSKIKDGTLTQYHYDVQTASLLQTV